MEKFTRSAYGDGAKFTAFFNKVQSTLKTEGKHLDSKHKKICQDIVNSGEIYFKPFPAKSLKDYESLLKDFVKDHSKNYDKVLDFLVKAKAA